MQNVQIVKKPIMFLIIVMIIQTQRPKNLLITYFSLFRLPTNPTLILINESVNSILKFLAVFKKFTLAQLMRKQF